MILYIQQERSIQVEAFIKDKKLKVLLVGPIPPPMGGIVRYCQDIIESELAQKNEITLFQDNIPHQYRPSITTAKNTWNIISRDGLSSTIKVFGFVLKKFFQLNTVLTKNKFDIMHVLSTAGYGFFRNTIHIIIAKRHGVKTVFHLLGQIDDLYKEANPLLRKVITFCLNRADIHIVQSPLLAEFVQGITKRPVYSIFNGVKTEQLAPPDGYAHSTGNNVEVVTLGYLGYQKGTFDILEVAQRVKEKLPAVRFTFVGGGEVDKFAKLAQEKDVSSCVRFLGRVEDDVCIKMLQSSDIFLLPSHAEGQPIALLEAMACGLPVISSTVGSIPEIIKEGENGFIVKPGDIEMITKYIETLTQDASLRERMGRVNTYEAEKKYNLKRVMNEIQRVYEKV